MLRGPLAGVFVGALTVAGIVQGCGAQDSAWEGPYRPIPPTNPAQEYHSCCEVAHAVLIAKPGLSQGRVLIVQSNGRRWVWSPAAPSTVQLAEFTEDVYPPIKNLFCSVHSVDSDGNIVVAGGVRDIPFGSSAPLCACTPQPTYSYVVRPETGEMVYTEHSMLVPQYHQPPPNFNNFGYYYPGSVRLPNGFILSAGGGSSPLTTTQTPNRCCDSGDPYFVNGWQYFDPWAQGGARWVGNGVFPLPGLVGGPTAANERFEFNYYPLLTVMPGAEPGTAFVFAPVCTNDRKFNFWYNAGFGAVASPSATMDLAPALGNAPWVIRDQLDKTVAGVTTPRNLYYPNGFLWPLQLDSYGELAAGSPRRYVVMGGCDLNEYLSDTQPLAVPLHPAGGRPAMPDVYTIDNPESGSWTKSFLPAPNFPRIYGNVVLLPDRTALSVGGANFDFLPFTGQGSAVTPLHARERTASPVFVPESLDLDNPTEWKVESEHVSPRLYHSIALLLPDGRVLVGGGYRGKTPDYIQPVSNPPVLQNPSLPEHFTWYNWRNEHSNFEIYNPPYLTGGSPRPQITAVAGSITYDSTFEITVAMPGETNPVNLIDSVCLMSPGSETHHFGWDQRYVGLYAAPSPTHPNTRMVVTAPAGPHLAPPGYYMLFVCTTASAATKDQRVPSVAAFVKLM